ncbi:MULTISPECIES: hypothetical protein [unclassified Ruegeria]|uniref:hypothetical protein n=1 Tax=unclassified Ruegeria TaxID=2625375 RepID=UPI0014924B30|nr:MULTISPECIES: hypothetical protein [unclassified Ruegeria]NOD88369.1 hypothetical protein [Ruegeria sp. HKCCD4318]NOE13278.1 hypothetical protein [Ruegeria sp. HKCCD4318-2]NOG11180.1 hypothetical protein [Ruegeria sp. HKCCD4315]
MNRTDAINAAKRKLGRDASDLDITLEALTQMGIDVEKPVTGYTTSEAKVISAFVCDWFEGEKGYSNTTPMGFLKSHAVTARESVESRGPHVTPLGGVRR